MTEPAVEVSQKISNLDSVASVSSIAKFSTVTKGLAALLATPNCSLGI